MLPPPQAGLPKKVFVKFCQRISIFTLDPQIAAIVKVVVKLTKFYGGVILIRSIRRTKVHFRRTETVNCKSTQLYSNRYDNPRYAARMEQQIPRM